MAGCWPSSFFVFMDRDAVDVHKLAKKVRGQYPIHLDRTSLVNKGFIIWLLRNFCSRGTLWVVPSSQDSSILLSHLSSAAQDLIHLVHLAHSAGFDSSCPLAEKKVKPWSQDWLIAAEAYPAFCSMKRLGVFLLSLDGMLVHRRSLPRNLLGFPNNSPVPFYTPWWREEVML